MTVSKGPWQPPPGRPPSPPVAPPGPSTGFAGTPPPPVAPPPVPAQPREKTLRLLFDVSPGLWWLLLFLLLALVWLKA